MNGKTVVFNIFLYWEEAIAPQPGPPDATMHRCLLCTQVVSDAVLKNQEDI